MARRPRIRKAYRAFPATQEVEALRELSYRRTNWFVFQDKDGVSWLIGGSPSYIQAYLIADGYGRPLQIDDAWFGSKRKLGPDILRQDEWHLIEDEKEGEELTVKRCAISSLDGLSYDIAKLADDPDLPEFDSLGRYIRDELLEARNKWLRPERESFEGEWSLHIDPESHGYRDYENEFQSAAWTFQEQYEQSIIGTLASDLGWSYDDVDEWVCEHYRRPDYDYKAEMKKWWG